MVVEGGVDRYSGSQVRVLEGLARILEPLVVSPDSVVDRITVQRTLLPTNVTTRELSRSAGEGIGVGDVTVALNVGVRLEDEHGGKWYAKLGDASGRVPRRFRSSSVSGAHAEDLAAANRALVISFS